MKHFEEQLIILVKLNVHWCKLWNDGSSCRDTVILYIDSKLMIAESIWSRSIWFNSLWHILSIVYVCVYVSFQIILLKNCEWSQRKYIWLHEIPSKLLNGSLKLRLIHYQLQICHSHPLSIPPVGVKRRTLNLEKVVRLSCPAPISRATLPYRIPFTHARGCRDVQESRTNTIVWYQAPGIGPAGRERACEHIAAVTRTLQFTAAQLCRYGCSYTQWFSCKNHLQHTHTLYLCYNCVCSALWSQESRPVA